MGPIKDLPLVKDANEHAGQTHTMARSAPRASSLGCLPKKEETRGTIWAVQTEPTGTYGQRGRMDWEGTPLVNTALEEPSGTLGQCKPEEIDLISFDDVQMEPSGTSGSSGMSPRPTDLDNAGEAQREPFSKSDWDATELVNIARCEPSGTAEQCGRDTSLISFGEPCGTTRAAQMEPIGTSGQQCLMDWQGIQLVNTAREEPSGTLGQCKQEEVDLISFDDVQMEPSGTSGPSVYSMELGNKGNVPMGPLSASGLQGQARSSPVDWSQVAQVGMSNILDNKPVCPIEEGGIQVSPSVPLCVSDSKLTSNVCPSLGASAVQWEPSRTTELRESSAVKTQEGVTAPQQMAGPDLLVNSGVSPNTRGVPLETISLCQTKSWAVFKLDVDVEGHRVQAVVDTAAEVTLISDRLFHTLNPPPPFIRPCKIATAGRELSMDGGVVGPVRLKLGDRECTENIYVAPLEDEMLLGFDLLTKYGANIDMGRRTITFQDGPVDLLWPGESPAPKVSVVTVAKRKVVPPNSVTYVKCHTDCPFKEYIIEPEEGLNVMVPRSVHSDGDTPLVCVVNSTDRFVTMKKGVHIASASMFEGKLDSSAENVANIPQASPEGSKRMDLSDSPEYWSDMPSGWSGEAKVDKVEARLLIRKTKKWLQLKSRSIYGR